MFYLMLFPLFLVDLLLFALFAIEGDMVTLALLDILPDFVDLDAAIVGRLVGEVRVTLALGDTVVGVFPSPGSAHANWVGDELFASH
eukprot:scaffold57510_cov58-Cyclotella_meneghiniana.AAC.1